MPSGQIIFAWPQAEVDKAVKEGGRILGDRYAYEGPGLLADVREGQPPEYFATFSDGVGITPPVR